MTLLPFIILLVVDALVAVFGTAFFGFTDGIAALVFGLAACAAVAFAASQSRAVVRSIAVEKRALRGKMPELRPWEVVLYMIPVTLWNGMFMIIPFAIAAYLVTQAVRRYLH